MTQERYILERSENRLQMKRSDGQKWSPVYVDFTKGRNRYRRLFGGGRHQAIAKAVGLKKGASPYVVDATAGLGQDAFVLASLGCRVHMIERSPAVAELLQDGLQRAVLDREIGFWVKSRLTFQFGDSLAILRTLDPKPEAIYLDPMFPAKRKSALSKKEMRVFRSVVGADEDAGELLRSALEVATGRVVVKRPSYAGHLGGLRPESMIKTRKHRFDIYLAQKPDLQLPD